jgi:hypothetical protein
MEQRKNFFADFGWHFFCVFVKISKKLQKPATHRKNNFIAKKIAKSVLMPPIFQISSSNLV